MKKYKSRGKAVEVTVNSKEENPKTFAWILSKNSASVNIVNVYQAAVPVRKIRNIDKMALFQLC